MEEEQKNEERVSEKLIEEKNAKVEKEKRRLKDLFKELDKSKIQLAENLIYNAAYMSVELSYLKKHNIEFGIKETYMNGANQFGYKESIESKTYNTMIKNYMASIKQLNEMLPKGVEPKNPDDEFDGFGDDVE